MKSADTEGMSGESTEALASFNVPNFDRVVVGASDEERVVKLETHYTIRMATELFNLVITLPPVALDNQALGVDLLPWSPGRALRLDWWYWGLEEGCGVVARVVGRRGGARAMTGTLGRARVGLKIAGGTATAGREAGRRWRDRGRG